MPGAPLNLAEPRNSELSLLATPGCECSDTGECGPCEGARIEAYYAEFATLATEFATELEAERKRRPLPTPPFPEDDDYRRAPGLCSAGRADLVDGLRPSIVQMHEDAYQRATTDAERKRVLVAAEADMSDEGRRRTDHYTSWNREAQATYLSLIARRGEARLDPEFWRGLEGRDDEIEIEIYTRRLSAYHATYTADEKFPGGRPLAPCYSVSDLMTDLRGQSLQERDKGRLPLLLDDLAMRHGDHWYYSAPFCRYCYGDGSEDGHYAVWDRLTRWLILNPGRTPKEVIPATVPGDEVEAELAPEARRDPYLSLDDLLDLTPAPMLVADVLPAGSYGVLRGRDGTKKSFLALDLAMHLAAPRYDDWHGGRTVDPVNYGRALYIVGEGVQGFGRRVLGWLAEHNLTPADLYPDSLTLRHGTVDLYAGGPEFDALITKVRELEPDLVVIDTLARSSGSADANSATDTSVMLRRVDQIKEACNGGTVLVVAHTTKGDTDSRGSSVIEDDADFVLAVEATDTVQTLTVAKMKDGPSGQKITLGLASVEVDGDTTLVLRDARPDSGPLLTEEASTRQHVEGALFATRDLDPLTRTEITTRVRENGKDVSRQSVDKALGALVAEGAVVQAGKRGSSAVYRLAEHRFPTWAQS